MENLLKLNERLEIAIELGESHYREFKSAYQGQTGAKTPRDFKDICYSVAKELVAFANADGGELFIGIEDNNEVTGIPYSDDKLRQILEASSNYILKDTPLPIKRKNIIDYKGKKIIYFSVDKGSRFIHQTSKGACFKREDRDSMPTSADNIRFVREEAESRYYDREFEDLATVADLDISLIAEVAYECTKIKDISAEKFLQHMELAEFDGDRLRPRKAALLLFAKDPGKWHPRSRVRIMKVNGLEQKPAPEYNVTEISDISGNIFHLIAQSWEALRPVLSETRYSEDGRFKTQVIYPETACREALINAITHRDYSLEGRGIEIRVFTDRLEILSPGKLLSRLTIDDLEKLEGVHESRNVYIARVLREYGYIRELGEGMRRMFEVMANHELAKPCISSPNQSFVIELFYKSVYSDEEKLWLDHFQNLRLSREQKAVIRLGMNDRLISPKEIFDNARIIDTEKYRQLVASLAEAGILKREISNSKAHKLAKERSVSKRSIEVYKVQMPKENPARTNQAKIVKNKPSYTKVFVSGLDRRASKEDIEKIISQFGVVEEIVMPKSRTTGQSKGFAFVAFDSHNSVIRALEYDQPLAINGRRFFLQEFKE